MLLHDHISRVAKARALRSPHSPSSSRSIPYDRLWSQAIQELEEELHAIDQSIAMVELKLERIIIDVADPQRQQTTKLLSVLRHNRRTIAAKIADLNTRQDDLRRSERSSRSQPSLQTSRWHYA